MPGTKLEDMHRDFAKAFNAGNLETLLSLYERGATLMAQSGSPVSGLEAIRESLQGFLALKGVMTLETHLIVRGGDLALTSCDWILRATGPDGAPLERRGRSTEVARRQPDGTWQWVIDSPFGVS